MGGNRRIYMDYGCLPLKLCLVQISVSLVFFSLPFCCCIYNHYLMCYFVFVYITIILCIILENFAVGVC